MPLDHYVTLGRSGLRVSPFALGAMTAEISPGCPDGFRVDEEGRVWTSSAGGVRVLGPDGARLGEIPVPEVVSNVWFGGPDGQDLYITAATSLYRIRTTTRAC
jgi:gluconolactonase